MTVPSWNELSPEQQAEVWRQHNATQQPTVVVKGRNPVASVALYAGLASLLVFPLILGLVAIVTGIIGLTQASNGAEGQKPSTVGLVLGVVGVGISLVFARLLF